MNLYGIIIGIATVLAFYNRRRLEEKLKYDRLKPGQKTYLFEPLLLPFSLLLATLILLLFSGVNALELITGRLIQFFIQISIYYTLLLLLLPLLRRTISALACGMLWLAPSVLYFLIYLYGQEIRPLYVITLPRHYLPIIAAVWFGVFAIIMLCQLISHLRFRRFLLQNADLFQDADAISSWQSEARRHGVKVEIPILVSAAISTPLTIGCFEPTMRLVLPAQDYSPEELAMIFQHELRHILRCDARVKFFMNFCTALCWFNPLTWLARRKIADDLELSCDEAVLSGASERVRHRYADLLLKSAGDARGFTSCLSAGAGTLRHRLRNVIKPSKRLPGGILLGLAVFVLISSFGLIGIADDTETVQTLIFDKAPDNLVIDRLAVDGWPQKSSPYRRVYGYDEEALTEYLASLSIRQIYAGNYETHEPRRFYLSYKEEENGKILSRTSFELSHGLISANIPYDDFGEITYIVEEKINWNYLYSLLDFDAPDPDPSPRPPDLHVYLNQSEDTENRPEEALCATKRVLSITDADGLWLAEYGEKKSQLRLVDPETEVETTRQLYDSLDGIGGFFGLALDEVRLEFSYPADNFSVTVENWDRSESYTLESAQIIDGILPLAPYSAHYTVHGSFDTVRNTRYEMVFYFDIGLDVDAYLWDTN